MKRIRCAAILSAFIVLALPGLQACASRGGQDSFAATPADPHLGWYRMERSNNIIPVFKRDGIHYTVIWGAEMPLKECPGGLECAWAPSDMPPGGETWKLYFDETSSPRYSIHVPKEKSNSDEEVVAAIIPEIETPEPMSRIDKPFEPLDARARPPRTIDDFAGWYQFVWMPWDRFEIRKEGGKFFSRDQYADYKTGRWGTPEGPHEVAPLEDALGFGGFDGMNVTFNQELKRYELVREAGREGQKQIGIRFIRPLARISPPTSPQDDVMPAPPMSLGIPVTR